MDSATGTGDQVSAPSLWAYRLLRPGTRGIHVVRTPEGPRSLGLEGPSVWLASVHRFTMLAVCARAFGVGAPWAPVPWRCGRCFGPRSLGPADTSITGLPMEACRRPVPARVPGPGDRAGDILVLATGACDGCGDCVPVCPTECLAVRPGQGVVDGGHWGGTDDAPPLAIDESRCIECMACVEACPTDALGPVATTPPRTMAPDVSRPRGFLTGLTRESPTGSPVPSWQRVRPVAPAGRPRYVLGLAIATMQENAAALVRDGVVVGAVEEERLSRNKHHGFRVPGRPHRTICNDLTVRIEDAFAWRAVRHLLEDEGIGLDDVDLFAVNGIPARFRRTYSLTDADRPPAPVRSGRFLFVPHHLAHAASAYFPGGEPDAAVFTVDGRGDRETAAFFVGEGGRLHRVFDVLSTDDVSIGGVYETISRVLGFGAHGQGSTMALAVMGEPEFDMTGCMSLDRHDRHALHEQVAWERFAPLRRGRHDPIDARHRNLAASVQKALEDVVITLLEEGRSATSLRHLRMAGGVALNCQMNTRLRQHFGVQSMFVQPAAHDGGTAIGAALLGWQELTGEAPFSPMTCAALGPQPDDADILAALDAFGLPARRCDDIATEVADLLAARQVVCWHQGRLEVGPRALGSRSILAHPGDADVALRLNDAKGREPWRPFAPSILAGHEQDWFVAPNRNPFMLFVDAVRPDRRDAVRAIVHADGTTRPQGVTAADLPRYHRMISAFFDRTGIPMVLNTSFNTAHEPIVCGPRDALSSFLQVGADWLAIGDWLVQRPGQDRAGPVSGWRIPAQAAPPPQPQDASAEAAGTFRRLLLRLGTRCNSRCGHCTIRDIAHLPDRDTDAVLGELAAGRARGCDEVVFLRGEPLIRKDIARLVREARSMGYAHVQVQTNGRMLAVPGFAALLAARGVTMFEVSLYGPDASVHDAVSRAPGSFDQTLAGLRALRDLGMPFLVNVPIVVANYDRLAAMVPLLAELGPIRVGWSLVRSVAVAGDADCPSRLDVQPTVRVSRAAPSIGAALDAAARAGLAQSVEGVVLCHLDPVHWPRVDRPSGIADQWVSDLGHAAPAVGIRSQSRPMPETCRSCTVQHACPLPWAGATHLFGDAELTPVP